MIDPSIPGSAEWWLLRLGKRLDGKARHYQWLERYYSGNHPLPEGDRRQRELFRRLQKKARTNYCQLIVDAARERLKVVGFRTGGQGTDDTDREAWQVWQANQMDANSGLVHTAALKFGTAYVIVGPNKNDPRTPIITVEDPCEVIHDPDPVNWRKTRAALKTWFDDVQQAVFAVVYLHDRVVYFRSAQTISSAKELRAQRWSASWWQIDPAMPAAANPLREVPVVPFINRPDLKGNGSGEFEGVIDIQDRINNEILDRLVITKMAAYRQRWAKGISFEDENGNPTQPFTPGVDLLWGVEDEKAQFGDFEQSDPTSILAATRDDVQDMASISKTPPHYLLSGIINASGDALTAAETGLVSKVLDDQVEFGESWETVTRLAAKYAGRAIPMDAETVWKDPQYRTVSELASAVVQEMAAGVPWRTRMRKLGYSPPEIDRMEGERASDALITGSLGPQAASPQSQSLAQRAAAHPGQSPSETVNRETSASVITSRAMRPSDANQGT